MRAVNRKISPKYPMRNWINLFEGITAYHGTNQSFDAFSIDRGGMATGEGAGAAHAFFFTDNPDEAEQYALNAGRRVVSNITEFEKERDRLKNEVDRLEKLARRSGDWEPYEQAMMAWEKLEIDATQEDEEVGKRVIKAHLEIDNPFEVDFHGGIIPSVGDLDQMVLKAKADGYDGLILHNINDSPKGGFVSTHYAVFDPSQITII